MLFWTPILEYIKIRPFAISKLSPDEGVDRVGGGTGKIWADSGVEGAGSGGRGGEERG